MTRGQVRLLVALIAITVIGVLVLLASQGGDIGGGGAVVVVGLLLSGFFPLAARLGIARRQRSTSNTNAGVPEALRDHPGAAVLPALVRTGDRVGERVLLIAAEEGLFERAPDGRESCIAWPSLRDVREIALRSAEEVVTQVIEVRVDSEAGRGAAVVRWEPVNWRGITEPIYDTGLGSTTLAGLVRACRQRLGER